MAGLELPRAPRVLVYVGLDLVGDGLIKLPFVQALRHAFPEGELIWLAGKGTSAYRHALAPLVSGLLDAVVDQAEIGSRIGELFASPPLAGQSFDLVIDTQRRVLTSLILKRLRSRYFISGAGGFLLSDVKPPAGHRRPRALVRELLDLLALATGRVIEPPAPVTLAPEIESLAARLLPEGPVYIALSPGAGGVEKRWPLQNFVTVASSLAQNGRVPVLLLGPDEQGWREDLAAAVHDAVFPLQHPTARAYQFRADVTVALARRCAAGVAADSGGGHLIAASGTRLVSLFGPTDPEKFAPLATKLIVLNAQRWGGIAMSGIPPVAVLQAIEELLLG
jgi:ADP-heptose:LPS heptosyltransferase